VSTILQVLISIQAMILCDNPENNDPFSQMGFRRRNTSGPTSGPTVFTQSVRSLTIEFGITQWAENAPALWKDIVRNHFHRTGDKILRMAEQWARENHQSSRGPQGASIIGAARVDIKERLPQLQKALKNYGATHVIQGIEGMVRDQQVGSGGVGYGSQMPPSGRGNRFNGPGGMGGYGVHGFGSGFGRGW
jgi:hypothetical protein